MQQNPIYYLMIDTKEVLEVAFNGDIETYLLYLCDGGIYFFFVWSYNDGVVSVQDVHDIPANSCLMADKHTILAKQNWRHVLSIHRLSVLPHCEFLIAEVKQ